MAVMILVPSPPFTLYWWKGKTVKIPVAESARAILDGHIVLSHDQAISGLYPCN